MRVHTIACVARIYFVNPITFNYVSNYSDTRTPAEDSCMCAITSRPQPHTQFCPSYAEQFQQLFLYCCCCCVLMDRSPNCRSQIASSHVAPHRGFGNSKRCIRRRHRRNPAPLASGNEILFVGGWSARAGLQLPEGDRRLERRARLAVLAFGCDRAVRVDQRNVRMTY